MRGGLFPLGIAIVLASWGSPAAAADFIWCVDGGNPRPSPPSCSSETCTNSADFSTLSEAVAAAEGEAATAANPSALEQIICLRGTEPLSEHLVIDLAESPLRGALRLSTPDLFDPTLCRQASADASAPLIDLSSDGQVDFEFSMLSGVFLASTCDLAPAPVLRSQGVQVDVAKVRIVGGHGPAVQVSSAELNLRDFRIQDLDGPALVGDGTWYLSHGEISSNRSESVAMVEHSDGDLGIHQVALHANGVLGAPLIRTDGQLSLIASYLGDNVVIGEEALVETAPAPVDDWAPTGVWHTAVEGNELLASGDVSVPLAEDPGLFVPNTPFCLPLGADGMPFRQRPRPQATDSVTSDAPLILVRASGPAGNASIGLTQNIIVGNRFAGALLGIEDVAFLQTSVLHNTIALEAPVRALSASSGEVRWLSTRNLFLSEFLPLQTVPLARVEATMDGVPLGLSHPLRESSAATQLLGPTIEIPAPMDLLVGMKGGLNLSACERLERLCPNLSADCDNRIAGGDEVPCALGDAVAFLPIDESLSMLSPAWPWTADWWESAGDRVPLGATGEDCLVGDLPFDESQDSFGITGDGDGFTELTDCDNENQNLTPGLPEQHDVVSGPCQSAPEACFQCPPELESDDDDSATFDDDDSGVVDDAGDPPDFPNPDEAEHSCLYMGGCGFAWSGVVGLLGLGVPRRRRRLPPAADLNE